MMTWKNVNFQNLFKNIKIISTKSVNKSVHVYKKAYLNFMLN